MVRSWVWCKLYNNKRIKWAGNVSKVKRIGSFVVFRAGQGIGLVNRNNVNRSNSNVNPPTTDDKQDEIEDLYTEHGGEG
jgi:hypothetical protein